MKHLVIIFLALSIALCSCNRHNEPPLETEFIISRQYLPVSIDVDKSNQELYDKIKDLSKSNFIVNSADELPDDPFGFNEAYTHVNFNDYTLLLHYEMHRWRIDTYRNRFYRDNRENTINWMIRVDSSQFDESEPILFTRFAILIRKLPEDVDLKIWVSLGALNWDWGK
ncbi:MAG: hypothetical protein K2M05_09060 [Paramuribaculum sp.]|nr:hypothetical protein [Paramuribaculum sp.]MDE6303210.1 hypothetical protein [Paramuribaculum sp.]